MLPCFRWFGPHDPVSLEAIRQCGCEAVFTALHGIPAGEEWTPQAIAERKALIEAAGLEWVVVESLPVSEAIKTASGDWQAHLDAYCRSLENLAAAGILRVVYNFMPVLDWVRTDLAITLPDGSRTVGYDPVRWAAFDLFVLGRTSAAADYTPGARERAEAYYGGLDAEARRQLETDIIDIFPGHAGGMELNDIRVMMDRYKGIDRGRLRENLAAFLARVLPVAEAAGVQLAIHPDDPPFPVLGLPRIVSTLEDLEFVTGLSNSPANGICICPGSLGVRPDNDLAQMMDRLSGRIAAVHLRNIHREASGAFREAPHLDGVVDMPVLVRILLEEQARRRAAGRADWRLPMRPDHGLTLLDDLAKPPPVTPGYTVIGRMKGLAELRGLQQGLLAGNG